MLKNMNIYYVHVFSLLITVAVSQLKTVISTEPFNSKLLTIGSEAQWFVNKTRSWKAGSLNNITRDVECPRSSLWHNKY